MYILRYKLPKEFKLMHQYQHCSQTEEFCSKLVLGTFFNSSYKPL